MNVGKEIKRLRESKHLTQRELAGKIGVKQSHVAGLEAGSSNLGIRTLKLLCQALGVSADAILAMMEFPAKQIKKSAAPKTKPAPKADKPKGKPAPKTARPAKKAA